MALAQQSFLLTIATLMLDGGRLLRAFSGALIASWLVSLVVLLLYRAHPTRLSVAAVKYGFWFAIIVLIFVGPWIGVPVLGV